MIRLHRRAALCGFAAVISTLTPTAMQAAPYYFAWSQTYDETDATRAQTPSAVALDRRGNVFVTGVETVGSGIGIYVAKYDALSGKRVWQRRINSGSIIHQANAIAVDSRGDCVVTGSRDAGGANGIDYYTIKLRREDGFNYWAAGAKTFNGGNSGADVALKVICDGNDDVIITGKSAGVNLSANFTGFDWVTIKYDRDDAVAPVMDSHSETTTTLDDVPTSLAVDSSNNVYVTGTVQTALNVNRLYLRKLQASNLAMLAESALINTATGAADAEGAGTGIAIDSANGIVVTSRARDNSNHFGYTTVKFNSSCQELWRATGPFSQDTFGTPYFGSLNRTSRAQPVGVAIGPDNNPIVTGSLIDASGKVVIRTVKYTSAGSGAAADEVWDVPVIDEGLGFGDTLARSVAADDAGNAIIIGDTRNEDGNTDVYVAKYDAQTGEKVFSQSFNLSETNPSSDKGVDIAVDRLGNIAALGTFVSSKNGSPSAGNNVFGTIKLNRLIAPVGDILPNGIDGVADDATVLSADTPAISTAGPLAAKLKFKAGRKVGQALFVEGTAAGGTLLPAVKGEPAPVEPGAPAVNWVSFSDPIVAPNGEYAFAGKVSGPGSKANGVWANLNGTLKLVLRQGLVIPVAGATEKLASVTNFGVSNNNLIALVKLAAPGKTNTALIRVDQNNVGTMLLRTGTPGLMIDGVDHTPTSITIFKPAPLEAGDGRWLGSAGVVAQVKAFETSTPKNKTTALVSITNSGTKTTFAFAGQDAAAPVTDASYSAFNVPATSFGSIRFAYKAKLSPKPSSSNYALIYHHDAAQSVAIAQKGSPTGIAGLSAGVTFADFSDPVINTNSAVAYIATLKGPSSEVTASSNKAIVLRTPILTLTGVSEIIARTGDFAPDAAGDPTELKWQSFTSLALPGGLESAPIFVGKLKGKNPLGIWGRDSDGKLRQLLRQGQEIGDRTVKSFTLLNTLPKVMAGARSFDAAFSVAVRVVFSDKKSAILRIGIP